MNRNKHDMHTFAYVLVASPAILVFLKFICSGGARPVFRLDRNSCSTSSLRYSRTSSASTVLVVIGIVAVAALVP